LDFRNDLLLSIL